MKIKLIAELIDPVKQKRRREFLELLKREGFEPVSKKDKDKRLENLSGWRIEYWV